MFEQSLVGRGGGVRRSAAVAISSAGQVVLIGLLIVAPLLSTSEIPRVWLTGILRAPDVPPPPPPAVEVSPARAAPVVPRQFDENKLMQPTRVPEKVALIIDEAPPPSIRSGVGVIGSIGVPGGRPDGVIGSVLSAVPAPAPPARPEPVRVEKVERPKPVRRVRVGGEVSPPVLIHRVNPLYPALARQVRASGEVRLRCVIGVDGRLTSLSLVSGHPLLVQAAMEAVRQWRYRPTLLNGEPVEVAMTVSVHFRLGR